MTSRCATCRKSPSRKAIRHPRAQPLRAARQNLYHTALAMGVPSWTAHHAVAFFVTRGVWALESTQSQKRYARRLRLGADQFQATRDHPGVRFEGEVADWIELAHIREKWRLARDVARISDKTLYTHFPELLIGGKYIVSMTARHDPTETYRMANWAIGQSLNDLDANRHWPRNTEEFAAWLAPRDKQILSRRMKGTETEDFPAGVVYEANKQALWLLNADGGVRAIAKLTPSEDGSTHFVYKKNGQTKHFDIWRVTRQLAPWIRPDGTPQLYGAFLPEEPHRAEKDINQQPRGVQLETDTGTWKVHIHANGKATVVLGPSNVLLGEWTINDGYVDLTTQDGQTQRWALASTRAERWAQGSSGRDTFNVPRESIQPWNYPERFAAIEAAIIEKPKTASALALEKTMERIRRKTEMYRQRIKATQAREEAREAAKRLQSSHEGR